MILNRQRRVKLPVEPLRGFLVDVCAEIGWPACDLNVCLLSDQAMRRLNRGFRGKNRPTDVLSFPARRQRRPLPIGGTRRQRGRALPVGFLGDIAISAETARRNARRHGRSLSEELRILILHGILHLMGYDHETDGGQMNHLEGRLRRRLGLS